MAGTNWPKGTSGNPGGMPKGVGDLARRIRYQYGEACVEAMGVLAQYARGEIEGATHGDRLKAISMLVGRVLGPEREPAPDEPTAGDLAKANQLHVTVTYGKPPEPIPVVVTPETDVT